MKTIGIVCLALIAIPVALTLGVMLAMVLWGFISGLAGGWGLVSRQIIVFLGALFASAVFTAALMQLS